MIARRPRNIYPDEQLHTPARSCHGARVPGLFWIALALLIVNDHVLKGSGWAPAWLSGKLSDVAGLIVAPLLLCALLRLRTPRACALAFAAVALPFLAVKLDARCAQAVSDWLTAAGVPSKIWADPGDLLALSVLPFGFRLALRGVPLDVPPDLRVPAGLDWLQRAGLAVACIACVATSWDLPEPLEMRPPFVINWTRLPVELEISARADLACGPTDAGPQDPGLQLPPARTVLLEPGEIAPVLRGDPASAADPAQGCGRADIAVVDGSERIMLRWPASISDERVPVDAVAADGSRYYLDPDFAWAFERAITVVGATKAPSFRIGSALGVGP